MKYKHLKNPATLRQTWLIELEWDEFVNVPLSWVDKKIINGFNNKSVADNLIALEAIVRKVERGL